MSQEAEQSSAPAVTESDGIAKTGTPITSLASAGFSALLTEIGSSVLLSTYQAGQLVFLRPDGDQINTHFRTHDKPMGIARTGGRLAIGGRKAVHRYHHNQKLADRLEGSHDACFVPHQIRFTGDIDIHEMAYDGAGELWFVNTRFGCLCTLDDTSNFRVRWMPHFISELVPEDRCHLNGIAMVDGSPAYVTALGATDVKGGWRENKVDGGLMMHVDSNEIIVTGLSMPHSPRWYRDQLWVLESGEGTLSIVDPERGTTEVVAHLPGFTRGLAFVGNLAFVGLSQVRESAIFSGLPIIDRYEERKSGVWVVNIDSGEVVSRLEFTAGIQEIFAVEAMPKLRPELLPDDDIEVLRSYIFDQSSLGATS